MRLRDIKYIGFKHQRENKRNSDRYLYFSRNHIHRYREVHFS